MLCARRDISSGLIIVTLSAATIRERRRVERTRNGEPGGFTSDDNPEDPLRIVRGDEALKGREVSEAGA